MTVILVVLPFVALALLVAFVTFVLRRNVANATTASGTVVAKRFVPAHSAQAPGGSGGGRAFVVADSWILDVRKDNGRMGTAVVDQETFEAAQLGDYYQS